MPPFPWHLWLYAASRSLRWLIAYEPPPGEAVSGRVDITTQPAKGADDGRT